MPTILCFLAAEDGAVTTDWVLLIGLLVGLALATVSTISGGVENLSYEIAEDFAAIDLTEPPF